MMLLSVSTTEGWLNSNPYTDREVVVGFTDRPTNYIYHDKRVLHF